MKVNSSIYKGIEYVQVSALPSDQKENLLQTINPELLIKILVDGKLIGNCLQYKDYESWFDNAYNIGIPSKPAKEISAQKRKAVLSTDHA